MKKTIPMRHATLLLLAALLQVPVMADGRMDTPVKAGLQENLEKTGMQGNQARTGLQENLEKTGMLGNQARTSLQDPLETTRKIADKIIRETSFDYRMVPLEYGGGIIGFTLDRQGGTQTDTWYAMARIESEHAAEGYLGLSFAGNITLFLNGKPLFNGSSDSVIIHEYTYDRYRFMEKIPVRWQEGTNEVLIRSDPGKELTSVLVLPLNEMDARPATLSKGGVDQDLPDADWILSGPWPVRDQKFPPESEFSITYQRENGFINWYVPEVPLLRELVIPDSASYKRDAYADWHYANGGTMLGILTLHQVTGEGKYLDFVKQYAENLEYNSAYFRWQYQMLHAMRGSFYRIFRMTMLDDTGGPALPFAELQRMDVAARDHMELLSEVMNYVLKEQERLPDGTLSRPEPEAATIWADDLFMSVPFLLRMAEVTGQDSLYDEVALQILRFNHYLADPETGLYFHGWYDQRKEHTPVRWSRANGWVIWATSEALLRMPEEHPAYQDILGIFRNHMEALARYQDPSGMWHQVLDHPETFLETSSTAMFTLGMARGARKGWLDETYREKANRAWAALREKVGPDGTVSDICRGTGIGDSVEFYESRDRFDHDPRGLGAMLTAGCEISLLNLQESQ